MENFITLRIKFATEENANKYLSTHSNATQNGENVVEIRFPSLDEAIAFSDENQDIHAYQFFDCNSKSVLAITNKPSCSECFCPLDFSKNISERKTHCDQCDTQ